ncbi:MAG: hypothetical protein HF962_00515 [Sulfurovum sp.]|nr:hypothetical protein [Sulfurovum sp.]
MSNVDITEEERNRLLAGYLQQVSVGLIPLGVSILTKAKEELELVAKAKYDKLVSLAVLKKQYGYASATEDNLGESSGDGLIDKQTAGFEKDIYHKLNTSYLSMQGILANNEVSVPEWQVDVIRLLTEFLTDGKIDVSVSTDSTGERSTTVQYKEDSTSPNGLNV